MYKINFTYESYPLYRYSFLREASFSTFFSILTSLWSKMKCTGSEKMKISQPDPTKMGIFSNVVPNLPGKSWIFKKVSIWIPKNLLFFYWRRKRIVGDYITLDRIWIRVRFFLSKCRIRILFSEVGSGFFFVHRSDPEPCLLPHIYYYMCRNIGKVFIFMITNLLNCNISYWFIE